MEKVARLVGLEPTASAFAGLRSIHLSYKRTKPVLGDLYDHMLPGKMVPKGRFELPRPCGHCALNAARLPFRHLGLPE